ncbi:hypothetical protein S40293_10777 [Stachybotrys chartarum IBT 40293]|nr:hypothetical protein S40293_10777 [Stachybotrys chartarum IBT 40293]
MASSLGIMGLRLSSGRPTTSKAAQAPEGIYPVSTFGCFKPVGANFAPPPPDPFAPSTTLASVQTRAPSPECETQRHSTVFICAQMKVVIKRIAVLDVEPAAGWTNTHIKSLQTTILFLCNVGDAALAYQDVVAEAGTPVVLAMMASDDDGMFCMFNHANEPVSHNPVETERGPPPLHYRRTRDRSVSNFMLPSLESAILAYQHVIVNTENARIIKTMAGMREVADKDLPDTNGIAISKLENTLDGNEKERDDRRSRCFRTKSFSFTEARRLDVLWITER